MRPEQLIEHSPRLYHLTHAANAPTIARYGLLSTTALLDRFGVTGEERRRLEECRRPNPVTLRHSDFGEVTLRDQHPLNEARLAGALTGGMTVAEWLKTINARVFLFADRDRATRLAQVHAGDRQTLFVFDTAALLAQCVDRVELTHMNTGTTSPMAHPRGRDTFKPLAQYHYDERRKRYGRADAIKEVTVLGGVPIPLRAVLVEIDSD